MNVALIKKGKISNFVLPAKIAGSFWITDDNNGISRNLISVEANQDKWVIKSNFETKIVSNDIEYDNAGLQEYFFYTLKVTGEAEPMLLYASPVGETTFKRIGLNGDMLINIGKDDNNQIVYKQEQVNNQHAVINFNSGRYSIKPLDNNYGVYVNLKLITDEVELHYGDSIFVMGLKIIVMGNFIVVNNPNNKVTFNSPNFIDKTITVPPLNQGDNEDNGVELYQDNDYFMRAPRFKTGIEPVKIKIDAPPTKDNGNQMPLIYTLGPMLTMGMTSVVMGVVNVNNVLSGKQTWSAATPGLIITFAMLASMLLWPLLNRGYEKRQRLKKERLRQSKYRAYLEGKRQQIATTMKVQQQILLDNNVTLEECNNIILNRKRNLWEREIEHEDFLKFRLGNGSLKPEIDISYPEEHFTLEDDDLLQLVHSIVHESREMTNVPISISLVEKRIAAIVGDRTLTKKFIDSMILQLVTFHSYEQLKIVALTNKANDHEWDYLKVLPHTWNDEKNVRFYANDADEMRQLSVILESVLKARKINDDNTPAKDYRSFMPYYIIIVDDLKAARNIGIINSLLETPNNLGFSIIIRNNDLSNLPKECSAFISVNGNEGTTSGFFENELVSNKQKTFAADLNQNVNMYECAKKLANIPIKLAKGKIGLPKSVGFLEMYNVGKIEQLNPMNRWKTNNPILSLQVPIGVDDSGELFKLDLHEKFHGPHGLVAGMTGSGKSEFIITYVLSLAINYHPHELSFVLIDYKGGGLAGAFENKETGIKIPHLAGSITNLDKVEMKRSLASIQSELRRRQQLFNDAREALNESTVDIYKYQRFYREGLVKEPIPHLFIISDEFAELKAQQPEFMEQLISTARIGRSLGVHLILATQKPAGVVDDQIWSNSKFRVCLKVQDKADSMDMIKRPDAADLKDVGRFYLQVGYNEYFAMGQSAYCGMQYTPTEKLKKRRDNTINLIDDIGYVIKSVDSEERGQVAEGNGEELTNIVKYLYEIGKSENVQTKAMWLDRIPNEILIKDIKAKYNYQAKPFVINPIIGEYDDPSNQSQGIFTLPLTEEGNVAIYGVAGAGEDLVLNAVVYSAMTDHTPEEVNFYILDFGSETLKAFQHAPHVGDVLLANDSEKVKNLFKLLQSKVLERKQLFADFNGDYVTYCRNSQKTVPFITVMIRNYEAFSESYEAYTDVLAQLVREGLKYGIVFIITAATQSGLGYRMAQYFKTQLVLEQTDPAEYSGILGNTGGTIPAQNPGRGLVKLNDIYEFQTAIPVKSDEMIEHIKTISKDLKAKTTSYAPPVPVLPDVVNLSVFDKLKIDLGNLPIGYLKEELKPQVYNLKADFITLISSQDPANFEDFLPGLTQVLNKVPNLNLLVIDPESYCSNLPTTAKYFNEQFEDIFIQLNNYIDQQYNTYKANGSKLEVLANYPQTVCIIAGFTKFKNKLSEESQMLFREFLRKGQELMKTNLILVDGINQFKDLIYEDWFTSVINPNQGIWLGNGVGDQSLIKLLKTPKYINEDLPTNFGYAVIKGTPYQIKTIEYMSDEEILKEE